MIGDLYEFCAHRDCVKAICHHSERHYDEDPGEMERD
jgi:hypothetical protein